MENVRFKYFYRDGSNFKKSSSVVFRNPDRLTPETTTKTLRRTWGEDCLFLAHQVRIPEIFLFGSNSANADDHCFHEFLDVVSSLAAPNDSYGRSIVQFIREVQRKEAYDWPVFDPFDRSLRQPSR
jgi:hypothetical protein